MTHCHADHSPLAAWLAAESGAPTIAFGPHGDDAWDIGDDPVVDDPADEPADRGRTGDAPTPSRLSRSRPIVTSRPT